MTPLVGKTGREIGQEMHEWTLATAAEPRFDFALVVVGHAGAHGCQIAYDANDSGARLRLASILGEIAKHLANPTGAPVVISA